MKRTMSFARPIGRVTGLLLAVTFLFSVAATTASAQLESRTTVDIPFAFVVGSKSMPAGVYSVERRTQKVLTLRSADGKDAAMLQTVLVDNGSAVKRGRLIFNKYGDEYFLSTVVPSFSDTAFRIPATEQEERLAKASGRPEVVAVSTTSAR
jgi:hypothetical protein